MRTFALYLLAAFFIGAGAMHFVSPEIYVPMIPPYLPWPLTLVYLSGVAEIAGGAGVLIPRLRRAAGWGLVALLIAIFPANIHIAMNDIPVAGHDVPWWGHAVRLPFQLVFIAWVVWATELRTSRDKQEQVAE
ncbi:MAG: DoxX family protein [Planctomycetaceae bacterium]|nr:DoxX family protein [Planctomycetaceae bacterium]